MDELTPPHTPALTAVELGEIGTRMADALDRCIAVASSLAAEADSPRDGRRLSCPLYVTLNGLEPPTRALAVAFRESGGRWPGGAGEPWTVMYDAVVNRLYAAAAVLVGSLADDRRAAWTHEESAAAAASDAETARSLRGHADFLALISQGVRAAGGRGWRVVKVDSEQADWSARHDDDRRRGVVAICGLRRGASAPRLTGLSMKVVAGRVPSCCRDALPRISAAELERADRIIRQTVAIPGGMTTHWVGEEGGLRNLCQCHPDSPYTTPEQVERYLLQAGSPADAGLRPGVMPPDIRADGAGDNGNSSNAPGYTATRVTAGAPAVTTAPTRQQDGPSGGRWLYLNGTRHNIRPGKSFALIAYMWCRDCATFDELTGAHGAVWGEVVTDAALRTAVSRANAALPRQAGWRIEVDSTGRNLTKKPLGG